MAAGNKLHIVSQSTLFRIIVLLIGIIYGTLHHYKVIPEDLTTALIVTLLLFLVEQFFEIGHKLDLTDGTDSVAIEVENYLSEDHGMLNALLKDVHDESLHSITFQHDGYKWHSPWAIHSYVKFWELLAEQQRKRAAESLTPLNVEAIHSCAMDIWDTHPLSPRLLDLQRDFVKHGGKIRRILCAKGSKPDSKVCAAQAKMVEAGVETRYYDIGTGVVAHTFGWDFLRTRELHHAVIWDSFATAPGQVINEAVYITSGTHEGKDLERLWLDVLNHSDPFPEQVGQWMSAP